MKAKVSEKTRNLFNPFFRFFYAGKQIQIDLKEFISNWWKYIDSAASYLYENEKELKAFKAKRGNAGDPVRLDMRSANRGTMFGKGGTKKRRQEEQLSRMNEEAEKRRNKLANRLRDNQEALKAESSKSYSKRTAKKEAEKSE